MANISEELALKIAKTYGALKEGLAEFRELKKEKSGWCNLNYVALSYVLIKDSYQFLTSEEVPTNIRAELKIGELEEGVMEFGQLRVDLNP